MIKRMKTLYDEYGNDYDEVITYCDIYTCDECPRCGDDCDGDFEDEDEDA